jgi:UDP-N-acetylmuramate--alanine ligase
VNWNEIHRVYFVGIGGIGMSALARYFHAQGKPVAGYDRTETTLTKELVAEGMQVHYADDVRLIDAAFRDAAHTLIVYTPAVPADHTELNYFRDGKFTVMKRAEVLGLISRNTRCIAVAGTHGKTTTSSMTAHILKQSGVNITAFLGGITVNYHSNYITSPVTDYMVVEADEFDRSFLHLEPEISVITSADPDHLDIYGEAEKVKESFTDFAHRLRPGGKLFLKKGLGLDLEKRIEISTYSAKEEADFSISQLEVNDGYFEFDALRNGETLGRFSLGMPGRHNVENTLAAIAVSAHVGVEIPKIQAAVRSFKGVKRRFERIIAGNGIVYIDDYAHHPKEIEACVQAARDLFPGKKITGVFQPHLYSRTRDFADGFAESLSRLDELILMDIYPARELPIEGVTSAMILDKVTLENKQLAGKKELPDVIKNKIKATDVLITMGAGDIDTFVQPIHDIIEQMYPER